MLVLPSPVVQRFLALLRAVIGFLITCHGAQKLYGILGAHGGTAPLGSLMSTAGILEFFGGLLLLLGLFTRLVSFVLSGEMAVAYFMAHASKSLWPIENGGELAVIYCFVFLYLTVAGGGSVSVDALLFHRGE